VGEAAMPERFALGTGLLRERGCSHPVGAHSVGEPRMPDPFAERTRLLRDGGERNPVGAHCVRRWRLTHFPPSTCSFQRSQ
jgi:hypothetical protein